MPSHDGFVFEAQFSPDCTRIVTASKDKTAQVWDAVSGMRIAILSGHGDLVRRAQFSSDGTRIVTASNDKTARVWDASTGMPIATWSVTVSYSAISDYSETKRRRILK